MDGAYTGTVVGNDYVVYVRNGSVTFKDYKLREHQQIRSGEWLPLEIEGDIFNGTHHVATDSYGQPIVPLPEGLSVDNVSPSNGEKTYGTLIADENFSGIIDPSEMYLVWGL